MESKTPPNKYQIAGVDERDRGFNRHAEIQELAGQYQAIFRYETFLLKAEPQDTEQAAMMMLVEQLHERGYTQLRTRLLFRGEEYLGNQEIWAEHPDPPTMGILKKIFHILRSKIRRVDEAT